MNSTVPDQPEDQIANKEFSLARAVSEGGLWIFMARWSARGIGFVSTIVLARLLAPEDFGLIAISAILISLAYTLGREAQNMAVIRKQDPDREFMDSAWTASILVNFALGLCIVAAAPFLASYFNEPRAYLLVQIMSLRVFLTGFENIGMALYRKNFNFGMSYKYVVLEKIFPAVITLALAFYLRNYWALAVGSIAGYSAMIAASFLMHEYRPRLCFKKFREVWSFSSWIVLEKLAAFGTQRIDYFFIPSVGGTAQIGHYHVGAELARMPTVELFSVLDRAIFPAYARILDDPKRLANAFISILSAAAIIYLPVSIGFALVAGDAVSLIYGDKWIPMIPVVVLISLAAGITGLTSMSTLALQAVGKSRRSAIVIFLHLGLLAAGLFMLQDSFESMAGIASVRLFATLAVFPIALVSGKMAISVSWAEILAALWRPALAAMAMTLVLLYVLRADINLPAVLRLGLRILAGGAVYASVLLALWFAAGKPEGVESTMLHEIKKRLRGQSAPHAG